MVQRHTLAVAVLLVFAGCGAGGGGADANTVNPALQGTPTATPSPTASPIPTPSPTPTLNESLPASLAVGNTQPAALAGDHRRGLQSASRTVIQTITVRALNGTLLGQSTVRLTDDGRGRVGALGISQTVSGPRPAAVGLPAENLSYWGNGTVTVSRSVGPNGSVTYTFDRTRFPPSVRSDTTGESAVVFAFRVANVTSVERASSDPALFRVHGAATESEVPGIRNVTFLAVVTGDGVVRNYQLSYLRERGGTVRRVVRTFRVTDVGETTVGRPAWFDSARNAALGNESGWNP